MPDRRTSSGILRPMKTTFSLKLERFVLQHLQLVHPHDMRARLLVRQPEEARIMYDNKRLQLQQEIQYTSQSNKCLQGLDISRQIHDISCCKLNQTKLTHYHSPRGRPRSRPTRRIDRIDKRLQAQDQEGHSLRHCV